GCHDDDALGPLLAARVRERAAGSRPEAVLVAGEFGVADLPRIEDPVAAGGRLADVQEAEFPRRLIAVLVARAHITLRLLRVGVAHLLEPDPAGVGADLRLLGSLRPAETAAAEPLLGGRQIGGRGD